MTLAEFDQWSTSYDESLDQSVQSGLSFALNAMASEHYKAAAEAFLTVLATPHLSLITGLYARFHAANCLIKALLAGEYDDAIAQSEQSTILLTNSLLTQAEGLLLDFTHLAPLDCSADIYLQLAKIQRMQARYQVALNSLFAALALESQSAHLHFECAQTYDILGLIEKAKQHFKQAVAADPSNTLIKRRYALFLKHRCATILNKSPRNLMANNFSSATTRNSSQISLSL